MSNTERVSLVLTKQQANALRQAVEMGAYATTSEVMREAVRDWQAKWENQQETVKLRTLWDAGKASGDAEELNLSEFRQEARSRLIKALGK